MEILEAGCATLTGTARMGTGHYLELIWLVERLHRHFLEVVKIELDRLGIHDINAAQAVILFNIGDAELTVSELISRGFYLGSNISYNIKKMVKSGYLVQERSMRDLRAVNIRLTEKGFSLRDQLSAMHRRQSDMLGRVDITKADLQQAVRTLRGLDQFWGGARNAMYPRNSVA